MTAWLRPADDHSDLPAARHAFLHARAGLPGFAFIAAVALVLLAVIAALAGAAGLPAVVILLGSAALSMAGALALRREPEPPLPGVPVAGQVLTGSVASDVVLDYDAGTAAKVYRPTLPVKLLYALSFQARFPYTDNIPAVEAARLRREIAGLLSQVWFGERVVVPALDVRPSGDGRLVFVTELVRGTPPRDRRRARTFLNQLSARFQEAGLPPWQVASYNPRAIGNLIEQFDGSYRVIDLESNLVTPFLPPAALIRAIRAGQYPAFDDIDVVRLRAYLQRNGDLLTAALGEARAGRLAIAAEEYATAQAAWHASERRIASKILRTAFRLIDVPGWFRGARRLAAGGERLAENVTSKGIDAWVAEGLLTETEAASARQQLATPEMTAATAHLGAHLAISVPLRFPLGSIARTAWTLALRAKGEWDGIRGRAPAAGIRRVHSLSVAALAAIPGLGSFAYLAARPFRQEPVIRAVVFDQALRHLPFRAYERLHLRSYARSMAAPLRPESGASGRARQVTTVAVAGGAAAALTWTLAAADPVWLRAGSAVALASAGAVSLVAFRRFWRTAGSVPLFEEGAIFLWFVAGVGLAVLAADVATGASAAAISGVEALPIPLIPGADELQALVLAGYLIGAAIVAWTFRDELLRPRASSSLILVGGALAAGALSLEAFTGEASPPALTAAGLMMLIAAASRAINPRPARLARPSEVPGKHLPRRVEGWLSGLEPAVRELARSRDFTLKLLAVSAVVVALSVGFGRAVFGAGEEHQLFRDLGPVTFFSSTLLAMAGLTGLIAWRRDREATGRPVYRDLWAAWGVGFIALAIEAPLDFHGKLGGAVAAATGVEHPLGFNATSDAIVAVYALGGLAVTAMLWRQVFEYPAAIARFVAAVPVVGLMIVVDGFLGHSAFLWVFEESVELVAASFFFAGFADRYRRSLSRSVQLAPVDLPRTAPVAA